MEKRTVCITGKVTLVKNIIIVFVLGAIISCTSLNKTSKNLANMPLKKTEPFILLARILELNKSRIGNSEQIILVSNDSIHSKDVVIQTFEKKNNLWVSKFADIQGTIGKNGFSAFQQKREGDNTSPTGIFDLGPVFGYSENVRTKMEYRQVTNQDFWIDDPQSDDYNKWVTLKSPPTVSHENMKRDDDLYKLGIVVQYNTKQVVKGNGSAIFVHIQRAPGSPTAGCVAMPENNLESIIKWLQPGEKPLIVMGTVSELGSIAM